MAAWVYLFHEAEWGVNKDYLFHGMLPAAAIFFAATVALDGRLAGDAAAGEGSGRAVLPEGGEKQKQVAELERV